MAVIHRTLLGARRRPNRLLSAAVVTLVVAGAVGTATTSNANPTMAGTSAATGTITHQRVCPEPTGQNVTCLSIVDFDAAGQPLSRQAAEAAGLHPYDAADLQSAYNLAASSALLGSRQTIAILSPYDNPYAEADLAVYRAANGLPPCTSDNGCFRKVDQNGGTNYPSTDTAWGINISTGLDMASAVCPNCQLLLVEADRATLADLVVAVDQAAALGANVISNGYGGYEYPTEVADLGSHYDHPRIAIVAAAGDDGAMATLVPAALPTVVAVGGTTLYRDGSTRGWAEKAWGSTSSGCSPFVAKPSWQKDRLCGKRTIADVSAVADFATPVAIYDTFGWPGWISTSGTPVSTSLIAGVYALAGNTASINAAAYPYAHGGALFDVTSGSNGSCGGGYLCNAVKGYDGPTGNGTPDGVGAF